MKFGSAVAIYFITWWVCLFVVLPFGVKNAHEAGEAVEQGNEHGAPVKPMLLRKMRMAVMPYITLRSVCILQHSKL